MTQPKVIYSLFLKFETSDYKKINAPLKSYKNKTVCYLFRKNDDAIFFEWIPGTLWDNMFDNRGAYFPEGIADMFRVYIFVNFEKALKQKWYKKLRIIEYLN